MNVTKYLFFASIVGIVFFISFSFFFRKSVTPAKTIKYSLNGKTYSLLTATNSAEWERGLMYYRKLDTADGMIFLFPDKSIRNFWNKNTFIDLDLYWIDDKKVTGQSFLPSIDKSGQIVVVESSYPVNKVVEIPRKKM